MSRYTFLNGTIANKEEKNMEYIIVTVPGREDEKIDVLINGEKNGKTGEVIILGSSGVVSVSVDLPTAKPQTEDVIDTTPNHPMLIKVIA
jgi:hypothetical protein